MSWLNNIIIAVKSLWLSPLRSFLTILANAISVTFIIIVVAAIGGINASFTKEFMKQGTSVFHLNRTGIIMDMEQWEKAQNNPKFTMEDMEAIRRHLGGTAIVSAHHSRICTFSALEKTLENIAIRGKSFQAEQVDNIELAEGRYFNQMDDERRRTVVILGHGVAESLFGDMPVLGKTVKIDGKPYQVIGRGEKKGSFMGENQDNWAEIPIFTFASHFGLDYSLGISIKAKNPEKTKEIMENTRNFIRLKRHLLPNQEDNFGIYTGESLMKIYHSATNTVYIVLFGVVALSLVVGGIVIANIMLAAVNERIREIGIRKAVGAKKGHILWQFLAESILLSLTGGVFGLAGGFFLAWAIRVWTPLPTMIENWAVFLSLVTVFLVGLLSGLGPAHKAASMDPVEALRYE